MGITITHPTETFLYRGPAQRISQGGRTAYYFMMRMAQFDDLAPEEVNPDHITHQRRFIPPHARKIQDYLESTKSWVLPSVIMSGCPEFIEFEPYPGQESPIGEEPRFDVVGELQVREGGRSSLRILDGQHRRFAIRGYRRNEGELSPEDVELREAFENSHMPVALYEEENIGSIKQMFADLSEQRPMDAVTRARFDMRDPFNVAAQEVMDQSQWIKPYVEMDRPTIARTSDKLVSFNQLSVNLKTLEYGYYGRVSRGRLLEISADRQRIVDMGLRWVDEFLPSARKEYEDLLSQDIEDDFLPTRRTRTLAYSGTMLRILAGCHYVWRRQDTGPIEQLAEYISTVNFRSGAKRGVFVSSGVLEPGGTTLTARMQEVRNAINAIVSGAEKHSLEQ